MVGYAVTAQVETVTECYPASVDLFVDLYRKVGESPKPGVVVLRKSAALRIMRRIAGKLWAPFSSAWADRVGLRLAVRDIPEVRALGLHYFARGAVASHATSILSRGMPSKLGVRVRLGTSFMGMRTVCSPFHVDMKRKLPKPWTAFVPASGALWIGCEANNSAWRAFAIVWSSKSRGGKPSAVVGVGLALPL